MRLNILLWILTTAACSPAAIAGEFPFDGYIAAREAEVASGPGRRFYTTDRLPRGSKVEVYREDDAGWLAIRPPEGSFSWVPAEHVELLEDEVGRVKSPARCWIGTRIENVQEHKSQISLKVGELVEIIDRKQVATQEGKEEWLKIAPPAGEYRYVHSRDVSRELVEPDEPAQGDPATVEPAEAATEELASSSAASNAGQPRPFRPSQSAVALRDINEVRSKLAAMRDDLAGLAGKTGIGKSGTRGGDIQFAQFQSTTGDRLLSPDGFVPRKRRASEQLGPSPVPSQQFTRTSSPAFARPNIEMPRVATVSPSSIATVPTSNQGQTSNQLQQLDLELSLMLAQDKSTWNLAAIRQRAQQLVDGSPTPKERGEARLLLDKIKRFEDTFAVADQGPLATSAAASADSSAASPYAPRYDAKGWLKPVVSRSQAAAPYAVVDADGKPLCFVTPSPGLNIGRYANKEVGLYGKRGYIEALKTPHVMAERVIELDRHMR